MTIPASQAPSHSAPRLDRRNLLRLLAAGAGAVAIGGPLPRRKAAADEGKTVEALLLTCIDYRLIGYVAPYMDRRGLNKQYDQFILAGASLGANTDQFPAWGQAFWEHVQVALDLHHIQRVIVMDHRDCGAYTVILGQDFAQDPPLETAVHADQLRMLAAAVRERYPSLPVETLLMALDGSVEVIETSTSTKASSGLSAATAPAVSA